MGRESGDRGPERRGCLIYYGEPGSTGEAGRSPSDGGGLGGRHTVWEASDHPTWPGKGFGEVP